MPRPSPLAALLMTFAACGPSPVVPRSMTGGAGGDRAAVPATGGIAGLILGPVAAGGSAATGGVRREAGVAGRDAADAPEAAAASVDASPSGLDAADASRARPPRPGEVLITEVLVNPAGDDLGREWIELAGRAAVPLDLAELHLATGTTDVAASAGVLAPGARVLLEQSADPAKNGGAPAGFAYGTKLILPNANGTLSVCRGPCANGAVLDVLSWGLLDDRFTGHALVVQTGTGLVCPAGTSFGTAGSFGTPGSPDPGCPSNGDGAVDAPSHGDVSVAD
jgi:hypothetical protein